LALFRSLEQRFAALYAFVVVLGLAVCAVAGHELEGMRLDSRRVVEESREQVALTRVLTTIDTLGSALSASTAPDESELGALRAGILTILDSLQALESDPQDPSRAEHQEHELELAGELTGSLRRLGQELADGALRWPDPEVADQLARSRGLFQEILDATAVESERAVLDLERRAGTTRNVLLATLVAATGLLCLALALVHHQVVRPIRMLRQAAERLGRGEFGHAPELHSADEIGDLARSFRSMGERLSETQEQLEGRVRERTAEFLRAARLADLGLLASGIAHEINTPLASIASSAEGLTRRLQAGERRAEVLADYARVITDEVYRAQEISTRMLALVRQEPGDSSQVALAAVLKQCESALRHRADTRKVRLATQSSPADARVLVHAGELVQMLVNLLANAVDASPAGALVRMDARALDGQLTVEVVDQGCGIPPADLERIFEPFFTTKGPGSGTGLGLALVSTMVRGRGGHLGVRSELGKGSTFTLQVPTDWSRSA
jgi:signal transduction histidine kinase